jgi:FAD-dependent oxidoreductase domain-containing protein 1
MSDSNRNDKTHESSPYAANPENPFKRTGRILKNDLVRAKHWVQDLFQDESKPKKYTMPLEVLDSFIENREDVRLFQTHCDVLVIGGGAMGSSIAYWLKKKAQHGLNVVVLEQDPTYATASTTLSVGGLRQQFSLPENIQMSLFGADFIRKSKEYLGEQVDVNFQPYGYLMLASEQGAETLKNNSRLQNELGARNELLTAKRLKEKFPWLSTENIALGCHGLEKEGWFDPWALLCGFKKRAIEFGAHYVKGEAVGFEFRPQPDIIVEGVEMGTYESLDRVLAKMPNGEVHPIKFALCVIACGPQSGKVAAMAKVGSGTGMLSVPLPIEPRKRYVYAFECDEKKHVGSQLNTPLVVDPSGVYFRREGLSGCYIGGRSPECVEKEPPVDNLDVDYDYFDTDVWPHLAHRVPKFEAIKVKSGWAGYYEFNRFDENGIIGTHPYYHNMYIASGFSGHGIQQAPAAGRAIAELIIDGGYLTIDLERFGFDRIIVDNPLYESECI